MDKSVAITISVRTTNTIHVMPTPLSAAIGVTIHGYANAIRECGRQLRWEKARALTDHPAGNWWESCEPGHAVTDSEVSP